MGKRFKDYLSNKQLMIEMYETKYGIYNHMEPNGALGSVKYNACEEHSNHYLFDFYLELFLYKGVAKNTGMSFDDFIDRPRYEIEKIIKAMDAFSKKESAVSADALKQLQSTAGK